MENLSTKSNAELEAIINNYLNEDLERIQQAATEFRNRGNGVLKATVIANHFGLKDVSDIFKYEKPLIEIPKKDKATKQTEAISEVIRKISIGHTFQFIAFLILLIVVCIVYFQTQDTVSNFSIYNLQESSDKLRINLILIKYGGILSLIILTFSSLFLSKVSVNSIEDDID